VIASIATMADDSDKNLKHNDEEQLQRLLDSMGQEKKSSKSESAAPRPEKKKKSNKGAVSKFREQQKQKRRGSIDTGAAREPAPAPRKQDKKRKQPQPRRPPPPLPSSEAVDAVLAEMSPAARPARPKKRQKPREEASPADACRAAVDAFVACRAAAMRGETRHGAALQAAFDRVQGGPEAADARRAARDAVKRLNRAKPGLEKRDAASLVDALGALDEAYHRLRYARRDAVPPPHEVFEKLLGRGSVVDEAADALMETLPPDLRIGESDDPLHRLYRLRWREGAWLFGPAAPWRLDERLEPGEPTTTPKRNDPVAAPTVHKWRDSARTWACREYAYAVPCDEALDALAALSRPIVEAGAGTGYWANALRTRGVAVTAYDVRPPSVIANAYHGRQAAHVPDLQTGDALRAAEAAAAAGAALFACYAPPEDDEDEAFLGRAASHFAERGGDCLALVGEWRGDTAAADAAFLGKWELVTQCPIPNWGDTSAALTVWRPARGDTTMCVLDACSACGAKRGLRRCRLTCDLVYCSRACAMDHAARRAALISFKFADRRPPGAGDFDDPLRFAPVVVGGGSARAKKKKKRRKK
jgi:hypothetical protein